MELAQVEARGATFVVRPGTHDPLIVDEHARRHGYARPLRLRRGDRVLDVGGHIGVFAVLAALAGAQVDSWEPDPANFELLAENVRLNGVGSRVRLHPEALVAGLELERELYVSRVGGTSASSFHVRRGRDPVAVACRPVAEAMAETRPTVVKLDCEGAEAELVPAIEWAGVDQLAMEYHVSMLRDAQLTLYAEVLAQLDAAFPNVQAPRHLSGAWTRAVYAWR